MRLIVTGKTNGSVKHMVSARVYSVSGCYLLITEANPELLPLIAFAPSYA